MSLRFLSPAADRDARSPLGREAAAAGARAESRDGWEVAVAYADAGVELLACRERVGFADRSQLGKLELQVPADAAAALDALGAMPSAGERIATRAEDAWWCRLTASRALVVCEPAATAVLRERLAAALPGQVLDVTSAHAALALCGPHAQELLARFCALDLRPAATPVGGVRPGSLARTPGLVLREHEQRWLLLFGAAYARYTWQVVADAAARLGGRPVGTDALAALAPEAPAHA